MKRRYKKLRREGSGIAGAITADRLKTIAETDDSSSLRQPYHPRKPRKSIKLDRIHPSDLAKFNVQFFCDQCSHYDGTKRFCTMGFRPQHTWVEQMTLYNLSGKMALCRFLEID